jgi:hypothetical protein
MASDAAAGAAVAGPTPFHLQAGLPGAPANANVPDVALPEVLA